MNLFNKIRSGSEKLIFIIFWFVTLDPLSIEVCVCWGRAEQRVCKIGLFSDSEALALEAKRLTDVSPTGEFFWIFFRRIFYSIFFPHVSCSPSSKFSRCHWQAGYFLNVLLFCSFCKRVSFIDAGVENRRIQLSISRCRIQCCIFIT